MLPPIRGTQAHLASTVSAYNSARSSNLQLRTTNNCGTTNETRLTLTNAATELTEIWPWGPGQTEVISRSGRIQCGGESVFIRLPSPSCGLLYSAGDLARTRKGITNAVKDMPSSPCARVHVIIYVIYVLSVCLFFYGESLLPNQNCLIFGMVFQCL